MRLLIRWTVVGLMLVVLLGHPSEALGATVTVDPNQGPVGTVVTATGSGWIANEQIWVYYNSEIGRAHV